MLAINQRLIGKRIFHEDTINTSPSYYRVALISLSDSNEVLYKVIPEIALTCDDIMGTIDKYSYISEQEILRTYALSEEEYEQYRRDKIAYYIEQHNKALQKLNELQ